MRPATTTPPAPSTSGGGGAPFAERVHLHGLQDGGWLAVLSNRHAPTVTISGTLQAGMTCTRDGRFAVATMASALLDRGTTRHDRRQLARELENHGLQLGINASITSPSTVFFSAQGLAEELPRMVNLLVEVLSTPTFPEEEVEKVRQLALGGLVRERQETFQLAWARLTQHLYPPGHPHRRRPVEERYAEVEGVRQADFVAFHADAYSPTSLQVAVVGDVEPAAVTGLFDQQMATWRHQADEPPQWGKPPPVEPGEFRIDVPERPNLDVLLGHQGSLCFGDDDYPAAMLANACLGQSTLTSRLGKVLRDREGLTYGITSSYSGTLMMPGPWIVHLTVAGVNLARAVELTRSVIGEYLQTGPSEEELADEQEVLAGTHRVALATNAGIARKLVKVMTAGEPVSHLDDYPEQLRAVTRDQVVAALCRHVRPQELTLSAAGTLA